VARRPQKSDLGVEDDVYRPPFLYAGSDTPDVLPPMARVVTVDPSTISGQALNAEAVAYPYDVLQAVRGVNDTVVSINHFWFSWVAFKPETRIYQP